MIIREKNDKVEEVEEAKTKMVFSSMIFLFRFLPIFLIIYYLVPRRMKNLTLFLGSLFFYAWSEPIYVLLLLFTTLFAYVQGRLVGRNRKRRRGKYYLTVAIVIPLLILGFFRFGEPGTVAVPIGISFYTLQVISYLVDVYRGEVKMQKNILDFAMFVTMFPRLIAGPIVRYHQVEQDIRDRQSALGNISSGAKRFVTGLAKKVLIADNIGELWKLISAMEYGELSVLTAWLGVVAFAFWIYFDFSGYSDMAIGLGKCLGFTLPENFRYPYLSVSVTDFWRRWNMTLGSWFKEYVYIPLGGSRRGLAIQMVNILVVWMLTGLWHGVDVHFFVWGVWFAIFLMVEKAFLGKLLVGLPKAIRMLYTWLVVLISWVFFGLTNVGDIIRYLGAMFGGTGRGLTDRQGLYLLSEYGLLLVIAVLAATPIVKKLIDSLQRERTGYAMAIYRVGEKLIPPLLLWISVAYIVDGSCQPFLYFRF